MLSVQGTTSYSTAERSSWQRMEHRFEKPIRRWQIADLTDDQISRMPTHDLKHIVSASAISQVGLNLEGDGSDRHVGRLQGLVKLARRVCRRQGY